jgi:uracil-DNA glycosylase family 4
MKRAPSTKFRSLSGVSKAVVACRRCPRLVKFRETVKPRAAFEAESYWRKPVPGLGDPDAELVVVGLAPAAHGGNRTGRVFTGDNSGRFLVRALHGAGFANQPISESKDDGLVYNDCYITAALRCAPPGDRPSRSEFVACGPYLDAELELLRRAKVILALGSVAFRAVIVSERRMGHPVSRSKFAHGARYPISRDRLLVASYHPSPRNTNTGKLTEDMLAGLLVEIKSSLGRAPR